MDIQTQIVRNVQILGRELGVYSAGISGKGGPFTLQLTHVLAERHNISLPTDRPTAIDCAPISELVARVAESQIGVRERGRENEGADIDRFEEATWLDPKDRNPWCASFVCWVIREALSQHAGDPPKWKRPLTPGAYDFERWARDQSVDLAKPPKGDIRRGDIVIFGPFSHIGIAVGDAGNATIETVEGNTNDAGSREGDCVARKTRSLSLIRSRIRLA